MFRTITLTTACIIGITAPVHASTLSQYRGLTLGNSLPAVIAVLAADASAVKVVSARPSLVQELTWRPDRFISGQTTATDSLGELLLTFHSGLLVRIVATYDRERTAGLTEADFQEALGVIYGAPSLISSAAWTNPQGAMERKVIGQWADRDTSILLWSDRYPQRTGLTIAAIPGDALMQEALAAGRRTDADEAPARELALRLANAEALRARNEKIRLENKARFKP